MLILIYHVWIELRIDVCLGDEEKQRDSPACVSTLSLFFSPSSSSLHAPHS